MIAFLTALLLPIMPLEGAARWDTAGMTPSRPAISYYEEGKPRFVMTCRGTQTTVQVRGFTAAQKWPQPTMSLKFGSATRAANPDLRMIGDQTAFEIITDAARGTNFPDRQQTYQEEALIVFRLSEWCEAESSTLATLVSYLNNVLDYRSRYGVSDIEAKLTEVGPGDPPRICGQARYIYC